MFPTNSEIKKFIDSNWVEETSIIFGSGDDQLKVILYQGDRYEMFFKKGGKGFWKKDESSYCELEYGSAALVIKRDLIKKILTN